MGLAKLGSELLREHLSLLGLPNKAPSWELRGLPNSFSSHWSGGQKSTIKVLAEVIPSETSLLGL